MRCLLMCLLGIFVLLGCSSRGSVLLNNEARASLSQLKIATLSPGRNVKEELSPEIRAEVLSAIKTFMTRVGRYPQRSVEDAAISLLEPMSGAAEGGGFAYRALVRVDRAFAASQLVEFVVFERAGKVVVKKISL